MAGQERTCVVCRAKGTKGALVRVVLREGAIVLDPNQDLPGRGGYVHRSIGCASKMAQPGRWERALRAEPGAVRAEDLRRAAHGLMSELRGELPVEPTAAETKPLGRFGLGKKR